MCIFDHIDLYMIVYIWVLSIPILRPSRKAEALIAREQAPGGATEKMFVGKEKGSVHGLYWGTAIYYLCN